MMFLRHILMIVIWWNSLSDIGGEKLLLEAQREITWNSLMLSHLDPCTNQCELEVQRIIHWQSTVNQLPNEFINNKKIVKSHISAANTLARIEVPIGQSINIAKMSLNHTWSMEDLLVLKIKFLEREKYKKIKSQFLKKLYAYTHESYSRNN